VLALWLERFDELRGMNETQQQLRAEGKELLAQAKAATKKKTGGTEMSVATSCGRSCGAGKRYA
jgi:phage regulator Rha-like protein